jgi:DNA-binding CsgD family transcriptional regulator
MKKQVYFCNLNIVYQDFAINYSIAMRNLEDSAFTRYFDRSSSIAEESFYVLDIQQSRFCYVKSDDLFLCGLSAGEALRLGYDFYPQIVYPGDLSLWADMRKAVLQYLKDFEGEQDEIDYFSCTFRLQRKCSLLTRPFPQMVYHRMIPVWEGDEFRYLMCTVGCSAVKKAGNLRLYDKDGRTYKEYNFRTTSWKRKTKEPLTEREKVILMFAGQGKSSVETAGILCKGHNTIRNQIKALFVKLNVHSIQEALEFTRRHRMIRPNPKIKP